MMVRMSSRLLSIVFKRPPDSFRSENLSSIVSKDILFSLLEGWGILVLAKPKINGGVFKLAQVGVVVEDMRFWELYQSI